MAGKFISFVLIVCFQEHMPKFMCYCKLYPSRMGFSLIKQCSIQKAGIFAKGSTGYSLLIT